MIVDRVSGMPFAEFCSKNLFEPIGMENTQWRSDFSCIVTGRAQTYRQKRDGGFEISLPFENVHGKGGLLTTVDGLLIWTDNLKTGKIGGAEFLQDVHRGGRLNGGCEIT